MSISGVKMFPFLDNWLVCPRSPQAFEESFKVFQALGFWIREKSTLVPAQRISFVGPSRAQARPRQFFQGCLPVTLLLREDPQRSV